MLFRFGREGDLLTRCRDLHLRAIGDNLRCHFRRNHLLHDQWNYAHHDLSADRRPDALYRESILENLRCRLFSCTASRSRPAKPLFSSSF